MKTLHFSSLFAFIIGIGIFFGLTVDDAVGQSSADQLTSLGYFVSALCDSVIQLKKQ